jgi:hypothetical protein
MLIVPAGSAIAASAVAAPASSPEILALLLLTARRLSDRCGITAAQMRDGEQQLVAYLHRAGAPVLQWRGRRGSIQD